MTENYPPPESAPDHEADEDRIRRLHAAIVEKVISEGGRAGYVGEGTGFGSWYIDREKLETMGLRYRELDKEPFWDLWSGKLMPTSVVAMADHYLERFNTEKPYSYVAEITEVIVRLDGSVWTVRRRLFALEHANYPALEENLDRESGEAFIERLAEQHEEQIRNRENVDAEEEQLGVNRVTNKEVEELMATILTLNDPLAESGVTDDREE